MESLVIAFSAVLPLCIPICIGILVKRLGWIGEKGTAEMNRICFFTMMPSLLFCNIYSIDLQTIRLGSLMLFCALGVAAELLGALILVPKFEKDRRRRPVLVQGIFRTNMVAMGLPLIEHLTEGRANGEMAVLIAVFVPCFIIISALLLEGSKQAEKGAGAPLSAIVKNPMILAASLAALLLFAGIRVPTAVYSAITDLAKAGSVLVLILLGSSLNITSIRANKKTIVSAVLLRTVFLPLAAILAARAVGIIGEHLVCVLILFGCPVATTVYTMTDQMGGDSRLAGELVAASTLAACLSLFLFSFFLKEITWI